MIANLLPLIGVSVSIIVGFGSLYLSIKRNSWFYAVVGSMFLLSLAFYLYYAGIPVTIWQCDNLLNNSTVLHECFNIQTVWKIDVFTFYILLLFSFIEMIIAFLIAIGSVVKDSDKI